MELQQIQTQKLSQQLLSVELLRLGTLELEAYVRELAQEGCGISRRTVAKYRGELGIPAASGRKKRG